MGIGWLLALVGTILVFVSAFVEGWSRHIFLFRIGCGLVFLGAFVVPGLHG